MRTIAIALIDNHYCSYNELDNQRLDKVLEQYNYIRFKQDYKITLEYLNEKR